MGVPHFYKWLSERYPLINQLFTDSSVNIDIENLYLDLNGLIHTATHNNDQILSYAQDELDVVVSMFAYIDHLISTIRPSQLLYLAVDGVPPRAKINQQRKRRFKAAMDLEKQLGKKHDEDISENNAFDSNCITPGTEFMRKVDEGIKSMLLYKIETDRKWQNFQVIYSGYNVPGEGEHKIIEYMRNLKREHQFKSNNRHCIYGLDADLILLSLSLHEPNIIILREILDCTKFINNGHNENHLVEVENPKLQLIHISILREYLHLDFYDEKYLAYYNLERIIDDFIFLVTLCGNDFLPSCPSIDIKSGSLTKLMDFYRENLEVNHNYILERGKINLLLFEKLCKYLSESEEENIQKIYTKSISKRSFRRGKKGKVDKYRTEEYAEVLSEEELSVKNIYYLSKFNIKPEEKEKKDKVVESYIQGLMWVLDYYYRGCPSWSWFYPYHYSPLFSDCVELTKYNHLTFELSLPVDPLVQLLCCLPPYSCNILPGSYRCFMTNPDSPIIDYYPKEFEIDMDGKVKDYEGEIIIPFIDVNKILSIVKDNNLNDKLTPNEVIRNTLCYKDLCYKYNPTLTPRDGVSIFSTHFFPLDSTHISISEIEVRLPNPYAKSVNKLDTNYNKEISRIPSLYSFPFSMKKLRVGTEVFGNVSKSETMVVKINKPEDDNKDAELGKYCYFGYPSQLSGIITSIKYGTHEIKYEESIFTKEQTLKNDYESIEIVDKEYDNEEMMLLFEKECEILHDKYLKGICNQFGTGGVELESVVCIVEIHPLINMIVIDNKLHRKYSKESYVVPFNVVRYNINNSDSKFEEKDLPILENEIKLGDKMIIIDKSIKDNEMSLFGNIGIIKNIINDGTVTIEISLNKSELDNSFGKRFLSNNKLVSYSLDEICSLFKMDNISVFRLLDSVIINKEVDIGLNYFDFHDDIWYYNPDYVYINNNTSGAAADDDKENEWIDNDEATLYIAGNIKSVLNRRRDIDKIELLKIVQINEDGLKILKDFIEHFPKVCELIKTKDSMNYKSHGLGTNKEYHQMINSIKEWRKENLNINSCLIQCKSERFTKKQLDCLNKQLNEIKKENMIVKIDIPINGLCCLEEIEKHNELIKKPVLGSRIISIGLSNIPAGLTGTVVSVYRNLGLIDIIFDEAFISGTILNNMCEIGHGQRVKYSDVIVLDE